MCFFHSSLKTLVLMYHMYKQIGIISQFIKIHIDITT